MNAKKNKQDYKVNVYLGKENYILCETLSTMLGVPIATIVRLAFEFGFSLTNESKITKEFLNKEQKRKSKNI